MPWLVTQAAPRQRHSSSKRSKPRAKPPVGLKRVGLLRTTALADTAAVDQPRACSTSASDGIPAGIPIAPPGCPRNRAG